MEVLEYDIDLDVEFEAETYNGTVALSIRDPGPTVALDCVGLQVRRVTVDDQPITYEQDLDRGLLTVQGVLGHRARLRVEFAGRVVREQLTGFYVSRFGDTKLLTTDMEPTSCRRFIPCVDRPDQKAVFRLRVTTAPELHAISNADVASSEVRDGRRTWTFEPTPRMATYLLYLGIGPFDLAHGGDASLAVTAATAPGKSGLTSLILGITPKILREYERYYGIPYPLSKLHLIGVPDYWAGAMENWGAITFAEVALLVDATTSPRSRQYAIGCIAHELAHQWFGNLVTMADWDDLWLNESFATFVSTRIGERLGLRRDPWPEFLLEAEVGWFWDSFPTTHAIVWRKHDTHVLEQSLDEITYFKGAMIVRMVESYLGEAAFRKGVSAYLERHRYGNARSSDLWAALEEASGLPVRSVMTHWVERPGLPWVRVGRSGADLTLEQHRFSVLGDSSDDQPWPIPLTIEVDGGSRTHLFDGRTLSLPGSASRTWRVNPARTAFVRVWYDDEVLRERLEQLPDLRSIDRWALVNDAAAFLLLGECTLSQYLDIIRRAETSTDFATVTDIADKLDILRWALRGLPAFDSAARQYLRTHAERLTSGPRPGEPENDGMVRQAVYLSRVRNDPDFARQFAERFAEMDSADPAVRPAIAAAYARSGAADALERLWPRVVADAGEDAAHHAAQALGYLADPGQLTTALDRTLEPAVKVFHGEALVSSACENSADSGIVWKWLSAKLPALDARMRGTPLLSYNIATMIASVGIDRPQEVTQYFADHPFPEASLGVRKGLVLLPTLVRLRRRETGR